MARVTRSGGVVAACVWDHAGGAGPLGCSGSAARELDPDARRRVRARRARARGTWPSCSRRPGCARSRRPRSRCSVEHASFEEWWEPFTLGVGPAGAYARGPSRGPSGRALRERCRELLRQAPFTRRRRVGRARPRHLMQPREGVGRPCTHEPGWEPVDVEVIEMEGGGRLAEALCPARGRGDPAGLLPDRRPAAGRGPGAGRVREAGGAPGASPDPGAFDAYLRRTVVNLANSSFRRKRVEREYLRRSAAEPAAVADAPDTDRRDELWTDLQRLPARQRTAIVLRIYEDLPEARVAEIPGAVREPFVPSSPEGSPNCAST